MISDMSPTPATNVTTRPALAGFLTLICPGLGDLYAGEVKRALMTGATFVLLRWLLGVGTAANWFAAGVVVWSAFFSLVMAVRLSVRAARRARQNGTRRPLNIGI